MTQHIPAQPMSDTAESNRSAAKVYASAAGRWVGGRLRGRQCACGAGRGPGRPGPGISRRRARQEAPSGIMPARRRATVAIGADGSCRRANGESVVVALEEGRPRGRRRYGRQAATRTQPCSSARQLLFAWSPPAAETAPDSARNPQRTEVTSVGNLLPARECTPNFPRLLAHHAPFPPTRSGPSSRPVCRFKAPL